MSTSISLSLADYEAVLKFTHTALDALQRIEATLAKLTTSPATDWNRPGLKSADGFLTPDGIELCYRAYDAGLSRYAVKEGLKISFGAATHRFHAWEKAGGLNRSRGKLSWEP